MKYKVEVQETRTGLIFVEADTVEEAAIRAADSYSNGKTDWKTRKSEVLHVRVKDKGDREWQRMR